MAQKITVRYPNATPQYDMSQQNELIRALEQTLLQLNNSFSNKIPENESERVGWFLSQMANNYKNIQKLLDSTSPTQEMYAAPSETTSVVKTINLYSNHGSSLDVTVTIYDASSATTFEYQKVAVDASNSVDLLTFNNVLVLEAGDKIQLQASQANAITMTAAVLEMTRA